MQTVAQVEKNTSADWLNNHYIAIDHIRSNKAVAVKPLNIFLMSLAFILKGKECYFFTRSKLDIYIYFLNM